MPITDKDVEEIRARVEKRAFYVMTEPKPPVSVLKAGDSLHVLEVSPDEKWLKVVRVEHDGDTDRDRESRQEMLALARRSMELTQAYESFLKRLAEERGTS